jgi:toxin-antitoxin system PIN domain toxin
MNSLSFPDVNVWLALILGNHTHRRAALNWWHRAVGIIAFSRLTQISVLRLLTTSAAMDGKPLTLAKAWSTYDKLYSDSRVAFLGEPPDLDREFRRMSSSGIASPKVWADALLVATAIGHRAQVVSFDRAIKTHGPDCLILE